MTPPSVEVYLRYDASQILLQQSWCEEQWGIRWGPIRGSREGKWCGFYDLDSRGFRWQFETEEMATVFLLRWA